jgi:nucleolar protein 56
MNPPIARSSGNKISELRHRLLKQAKIAVSEGLSGPDTHVVRAVQTAKNMEALFNLLYEQTIEWYALHFPEMRQVVRDPVTQLSLVVRVGERKNFSKENLHTFFSDDTSLSRILDSAKNSSGGEIAPATLKSIQGVAQAAIQLKEEQKRLQDFASKQMVELAPNFSELATPSIAGQLLSKAGSLKRLAEMPASTIQVLGAEEALFSHIKSKTRPPKHGFIFNHPFIKPLPKHARGKMARALAGKLAICIRVDFFGKERIVGEYKPKLEALSRKLAKSLPHRKPFARQ